MGRPDKGARARLRARVEQRLEAARGKRGRTQPGRHRRRALFVALCVALLLLLRDCTCGPVSGGGGDAGRLLPDASVDAGPRQVALDGARVRRAKLPPAADAVVPWIAELQLQVAARSVRLARCFEGRERPGAIRWTAQVDPAAGQVSEHQLESVGDFDAPRGEERRCLLSVLSTPRFRLGETPAQALPTRISLVIEF